MTYPKHVRIGVPPGVGDTYWVLTKLQAFRKMHGIEHVTLCVKKTHLTRALDWPRLVSFVDATEEFAFEPDDALKQTGFSRGIRGVHCAMWPNSVIDTGRHLGHWLPGLALDQSFEIRTAAPPVPDGSVVIYASSDDVNANWLPGRGAPFWAALIDTFHAITGKPPVLIGKDWDRSFRQIIRAPVVDLVGQTSLAEVAAILKGASVVTGVICGMTILANHFRTPTVALYPNKFLPGFLSSWITDDMPYSTIAARAIRDPAQVAMEALRIARPMGMPVAPRASGVAG